MSEKVESIVGGLLGILGYIIFTIGGILPFYAAVIDIKRDQFFMAALDVATVIVGIVSGIMYFFGWI